MRKHCSIKPNTVCSLPNIRNSYEPRGSGRAQLVDASLTEPFLGNLESAYFRGEAHVFDKVDTHMIRGQ